MSVIEPIDENVLAKLQERFDEMIVQGSVYTEEQTRKYVEAFRERFGPDRLQNLDGEELLSIMHDSSNRESMVYWLEFKNDEEFPAAFGSIAGGSALKFGLYKRKETGAWMAGSPTKQNVLSLDQAIEIARRNRQQLIEGSKVLGNLDLANLEVSYDNLQEQMDRVAPDVSNTSWGHKYFSLLQPEKLDDFHAESYQRHYLIKLQLMPPAQDGRYVAAGIYVAIAQRLEMLPSQLSTVLNSLFGGVHKYWRIGTKLGGERSIWDLMKENDIIAVGYEKIGDVSSLSSSRESRDTIRDMIVERYGSRLQTASNEAGQLFHFAARVEEGDYVLAADGLKILGVGRVSGEYFYEPNNNSGAPHRRPVEWLSLDTWRAPTNEGLRTTVKRLRKFNEHLIAVERAVQGAEIITPEKRSKAVQSKAVTLTGIPARIQSVLRRKSQCILYGPPGTGKTYWAVETACDLAAINQFNRRFRELNQDEQVSILGDERHTGIVRKCTFHPAYGYEDFIEGFKPEENSTGQLIFTLRNGIFKQLCKDAENDQGRDYYLIIDEINRGDIPRIFGELLTLLEQDKRTTASTLPLSGQSFSVPKNVRLIGTMNTADRSIALLDTALRRRFGFIELMPDYSVLDNVVLDGSIPLGPWLSFLNTRIREHIGRDARNLQVGHAYLMSAGKPVTDMSRFMRILAEDIIPLLEEYCYEDYSTLKEILGAGFVDVKQQSIRTDLVSMVRKEEFIRALLESAPGLTTTNEVLTAGESDETAEDEEQEDETVDPIDESSSI